jgi:hypothetical protein
VKVKPVELILERAEGVRRVGSGWMVSCPLPGHGRGFGDRKPSVSVTEGDDSRALVNCQAGCQTEDIVAQWDLNMSDLFENRNVHRGGGSYTSQKTTSTDQPATLKNYAAYVGLPVAFLKGLGLKEYRHLGEPAVSMPYLNENGEVLLTRSRVSLTGKPKVKTRKGDKHRLYGLWKLQEPREAGYAWMVEGESDWQTLCFHGEPAVGIPGADGWKPEWAADLEGIDEDEAGEACWQKLAATPEIRDRLYRVELEGAKDVSELHKRASDGFVERLRKARDGAQAWTDLAAAETHEKTRKAWARCEELAQSTDILAKFSRDLEACRVVGEQTNALLLFLALMSRLLDKIVSVAVKGPSSGGQVLRAQEGAEFLPKRLFHRSYVDGRKGAPLYRAEPFAPPHHLVRSRWPRRGISRVHHTDAAFRGFPRIRSNGENPRRTQECRKEERRPHGLHHDHDARPAAR